MTDSNVTDQTKMARILIVEDAVGVARAVARTLSLPQGGSHRVEICETGEAALERLHSAHFDLLITDLRLPGMNGLAVLEHIHQLRPETRCILITAFGSPLVEERARHLANAYLPKPFRLHDLIQLVRRILSEPATHKQFAESDIVRRHDTPPRPVTGSASMMAKRKAAYLKVFVCDLDGTLAEQGRIMPETWEILRQARRNTASPVIILVTNRTLESYTAQDGYTMGKATAASATALCDAIVAENGAVLYFSQRETETLPFGRLSPALTQRLSDLDIPLERGKAIVATRKPHDETVLRVLREVGDGTTLESNRDTVVVLPPGATKGAGLRHILQELGYSFHNVVACGDAENDCSLFEMAELAVALSNAPADVQALADAVLPQPGGLGVQTLITTLLAGRVPDYMPRPIRRLSLGHRMSGAPIYLDPFALVNGNLGVFGIHGGDSPPSASLAEELSRQEYQVCIIDPRGVYQALSIKPHGRFLGGPETRLPPVADLIASCESDHASLVLDLAAYTVAERAAYVQELLPAMQNLRARLGRPHWFLVDEAHSLCSPGNQLSDLFLDSLQGGGFGLVSECPSQMPLPILKALDCWLVTRMNEPEEIEALKPFLTRYAGGPAALSQLPSLPAGQAYLNLGDVEQPSLSTRGFIKLRLKV